MSATLAPDARLNRHHRCCAYANGVCAAVVLVQIREENEPLLFCGHHYDKAKAKIALLDPYLVIDTRDEVIPATPEEAKSE